MIPSRETTIRYIAERRCESGGYCFYRLDEPNAGDTFYAIASLAILDAVPRDDEATLAYLHGFQQQDGSFPNMNVGYTVIRSLALLGERPVVEPTNWILSSITSPGDTSRPVESSSLFEPLYQLTDLCRVLGITIPSRRRDELVRSVLRYRNTDTGFGESYSTMIETAHALSILGSLNAGTPLREYVEFLKRCEDPEYGLLSVPRARPAFLEHIHAGILACSLTGYHSPVLGQCEGFIHRCLRDNGGYVRSVFGGSATMENTYLAMDAFRILNQMRNNPERERDPSLRCCD